MFRVLAILCLHTVYRLAESSFTLSRNACRCCTLPASARHSWPRMRWLPPLQMLVPWIAQKNEYKTIGVSSAYCPTIQSAARASSAAHCHPIPDPTLHRIGQHWLKIQCRLLLLCQQSSSPTALLKTVRPGLFLAFNKTLPQQH